MMDGIKGFTGISVSLDLAVFVTIILTLITWKITKDKERNELREKEKDNAKKELLKYLEKLRDNLRKIIDFRNFYESESHKLSDEAKNKLQIQNKDLIPEYKKNLYEFLFISSVYNKELYKILKKNKDDFEFAQKHENIEIIVFSSVITMYKLLVEYVDEEIANDFLMTYYSITKEDAEKNLEKIQKDLSK